ncbi:MAG: hypothetical protein H6742_07415 [Alphaproteobacteria bacterium]|nr:hypothetical protein [Alphaproteobacteria bacterium]
MAWVLALGLATSGCIFQVRSSARDPVAEALAACEQGLGEGVPSREAVDGAIQCLLDADVAHASEPRIHAALARGTALRALRESSPARAELGTAKGWGLRCLGLRATTAGRLEAAGGRVTDRVIAVVPEEDVPCLVWTVYAWSHWLASRGPAAAAVDLAPVEGLARRAVELSPGFDRGRPQAMLGLALGIVPPALSPQRDEALAQLSAARQAAPDRLNAAVDTAALVYGPAGEHGAWRRTLEAVADSRPTGSGWEALEDEVARRRARDLLAAGPPTPDPWEP